MGFIANYNYIFIMNLKVTLFFKRQIVVFKLAFYFKKSFLY